MVELGERRVPVRVVPSQPCRRQAVLVLSVETLGTETAQSQITAESIQMLAICEVKLI